MSRFLFTCTIAVAAASVAACSAPASCRGTFSEELRTDPRSGSAVLADAGARESWLARVSLVGGPVLEPDFDFGLRLFVGVRLTYPGRPTGAAEMPRLRVGSGAFQFETDPFPSAEGMTQEFPLASSCSAPASGACSGETTVTIERIDGAIFPPVALDWSAQAALRVSDCPPNAGGARLELEVRRP